MTPENGPSGVATQLLTWQRPTSACSVTQLYGDNTATCACMGLLPPGVPSGSLLEGCTCLNAVGNFMASEDGGRAF